MLCPMLLDTNTHFSIALQVMMATFIVPVSIDSLPAGTKARPPLSVMQPS